MGSSYYLLYQYAYGYLLLHFDIVMVQEDMYRGCS